MMVEAYSKSGSLCPRGKASYPSSVIMNVVPAKVAGVNEIVLVSPSPNGFIILYSMPHLPWKLQKYCV